MIVGVTGTRKGCNSTQHSLLIQQLENLFTLNSHFHHGDCVGVDKEAHDIAVEIGYVVFIHPHLTSHHRAFCRSGLNYKPKTDQDRNRDIVLAVDHLLVVPLGPEELYPRSGTWQTYRMALKYQKLYTIIQGDRW